MTSAGSVTVDVAGRDVNLVALLTQMEARMQGTNQIGIQLSETTGTTFTAAQQRAANAAIAEAQAIARAAVAAGDDARAHTVLVNALGQSAAANDRNVASLTAQITNLQRGSTLAAEFGAGLKSGLLGVVGPATLAAGAFQAVTGTVDSFAAAFKFKADLDATTASINAQLKGVRDTGQVYAQAAQFANTYKLTQKETTEAVAASIGVMRSSRASVEDILGVLARLQVLSPEQSLQEAAVAVKALASGDTQSLVTRFEVSRDKANEMKKEIAGGADAVQVLNTFLNNTGIGMDTLAAKTTGVAGKMKEVAIAQEQLALAQAKFAEGPGLTILQGQINVTQGATRLLSGDMATMGQAIEQAGARGTILTGILGALSPGLAFTAQESAKLKAQQDALAAAQAPVAGAMLQAAAAAQAQAAAQAPLISGMQQQIAASIQIGNAARQEAADEQALIATIDQDAAQSQINAIASQTLALRKQELAQQAQIAANALLGSGDAGAAAAGRLAASSSLVDQLTAAYYRLAQAQFAATGQALAHTSASRTNSDVNDVLANKQSVLAGQRKQEAADYQAAQAAARRYHQELGNFAPAIEKAEAELAQLPAGSAAAYDKMTELARLKEQQAQAAKRAAGRAGGAARLSDQQKLDNQLLSDQERFADQAENAERAHQQKLLDIDREFQEKSLAQQRANEVSKRQSRADFYDDLTGSTKDVGQQVAQELSAAYEAAYAKAQAIAQSGNQKLAADYLALKQRQIQAELDFQKKLAEARKNHDTAEVERLQQVHKLQQEAAAEEEKQLLEGGDANVNARDQAQAEENQRFAEQQDKTATAAEQAAERKVQAAVRSGKAVSAETDALKEQETILNRMGRTAAPGAAAGAPSPAVGAAAASPTTPVAGGADLVGLTDKLQAVVDAVKAAQDAITKEQGNTTRAVSNLSASRLIGTN